MRFARVLAAFLFVSALLVQAQTPDRAAEVKIAFARAQHLRHGINASIWFAQHAGDYSADYTDHETTPDDIATMARLGFDNVRLSIDPVPLEESMDGESGSDHDFLARLDKAVDTILADGMAVQIDIHPEESYKQAVRTSDLGAARFVMLWRRLAAHYADRDPERVFFEVMNEPEVQDGYRWAGIEARAIAAIREAAPKNTIIAAGANWSDIVDLVALQPFLDGNVIYNFHFYDPHEFTHQGATWGMPYWVYEHQIPYPATEATMAEKLDEMPDPVSRFYLENYWLDHWDAHRIRLLIDEAGDWGRAHNVPVICNEFGVYRKVVDPADRAAWLRDVRTALEANNIGWAMWDYNHGFGVAVKDANGKSVVDPQTVEALGLKEK